MAFTDIFLGLSLMLAVLAVIADLRMGRSRRQAAALSHKVWWDNLGEATYSRLMAQAAAGFVRFPAIPFAKGWPRLRSVTGWLVTTGLVGMSVMGAGIVLFASVPASVMSHTLSYFAIPGIGVSVVSLVLGATPFARIAHASSMLAQLLYAGLLMAQTALLWILLMHLGTWLEWQEKATPTAYGSEWFYAEVYMEYVREPAGQLISLTMAVLIGLPAALYIVRICLSLGFKSLRPILAPALIGLMKNFANARSGVYALSALLFVVLAGLARFAPGAF